MTLTAHVATGVLVAVATNNLVLGTVAAIASHFVIDTIPHWNQRPAFLHRRYIVPADIIAAIILTFVLVRTINAPSDLIVLGALGGVIPDFMWFPSEVLHGTDSPRHKNNLLHRARRMHAGISLPETGRGFFVELGWLALMLVILYIAY